MTDEGETFKFERTYTMHPNPVPRMDWDLYEVRVVAEWTKLLASEEECNERRIHQFLVEHPSMIPGAYSMTGPSGHAPFPYAVLSESPLSAVGMRIPDFIWLSSDSCNFTPVFVEIESPRKVWFRKDETPSSDLIQATNQLAQWRSWFNLPENSATFYQSFEIPEHLRRHHTLKPHFVLIYGRRKEFDDRPQLRRLRHQFDRPDQTVMTFDRLSPASDCDIYMTATKRNSGYRALSVSATMQLGPNLTEPLTIIEGISEAVEKNAWISTERKQFLAERIPYWRAWAEQGSRGIICSGDYE